MDHSHILGCVRRMAGLGTRHTLEPLDWHWSHFAPRLTNLKTRHTLQVPHKGMLEVHYTTDHTSDETIKSRCLPR